MSKHTPAPWEIREDTQYPLHGIWANNSKFPTYIARTCFAPNSEANAKLIAAAPELLEALEFLLKAAIHCDPFFETRWSIAADKAKAAIKKATE